MYCVNSNGMNNMISFSLLENENTDGFKYPLEKLKEFAYKAPKICIIERNLNLTKAIQSVFPDTKVFFDSTHLYRSLKKQFEDIEDKEI